jgi:hypothetical protein
LANGFSAPDGGLLIVAHRGRVVDPVFSFHYHGIVTGHRLVCLLTKARRRCRRCIAPAEPEPSRFALLDRLEASVAQASAHLQDRVFACWELRQDFPLLIRDLLDKAQPAEGAARETRWPTVVPSGGAIGEKPIPGCFLSDCVAQVAQPQGMDWRSFTERASAPECVGADE